MKIIHTGRKTGVITKNVVIPVFLLIGKSGLYSKKALQRIYCSVLNL